MPKQDKELHMREIIAWARKRCACGREVKAPVQRNDVPELIENEARIAVLIAEILALKDEQERWRLRASIAEEKLKGEIL